MRNLATHIRGLAGFGHLEARVAPTAGPGGNVEGSGAGQRVVTDNAGLILGYTDLPGRLPGQASQLYGTNMVNLLKLPTKDYGRPAGP